MAGKPLNEFGRPERRRHQRANVTLSGRYMLTDRHEYDCRTIDISSSGVAVLGPIKGAIGERVVAYFDRIGRVEGMIVRHFGTCFAVELRASMLKRDKLDLQIESLVKQQSRVPAIASVSRRRHDGSRIKRLRLVGHPAQ